MDIIWEILVYLGYIVLTPVILLMVLIALVAICSPLIFAFNSLFERLLISRFFKKYGTHKKVFFVHSDHYKWNEYLQNDLFPLIDSKTVFYEWSKESDRQKDHSFERKLFEHWRSKEEFSPMAILFTEDNKARIFRFYRPLLKNYRGNNAKLERLQREFLKELNISDITPVSSL